MESPVAPRRAIDAPRRDLEHPRRAISPEVSRPLQKRRLLIGAGVVAGMLAGAVAVPFVAASDQAPTAITAAPVPVPVPQAPSTAASASSALSKAGAAPQAAPKSAAAPKPAVPGTPEPVPRETPVSRKATRPAPVVGIPNPCSVDQAFPDDASMSSIKADLEERWGLTLTGDGWTNPQYRSVVKVLWQTLDAVDCTPYLDTIREKTDGTITINATNIRGYAWGDWGLTRPGSMSLDFAKMQQGYESGETTRIARVFIHELAHVYSVDRGGSGGYWGAFAKLYAKNGSVTSYDARRDTSETYAEVIAHYVVRCADQNPYSTPGNGAYYDYAKARIFGDKEFGPTSGTHPTC